MTERQQKIQELMEKGLTESQAVYACDKTRGRNVDEYKPKPRHDKKPKDLKELGIQLVKNSESEYGWDVLRNGKKKVIFVAKGSQYKDGSCKYYPAIAITNNYKQKLWSLSSLIWLGYLNKGIPAGYVVDHIDNDSFNNDPDNLQLLTIRQNIEKNPSKKWYSAKQLEQFVDAVFEIPLEKAVEHQEKLGKLRTILEK